MTEPSGPRYSIVIPAYHSEQTLARCLESLRRQTYRDFEVVVVDSSPNELGAGVVRGFPEVRLLRPGRRMRAHEARNAGVAATRGERLVFTDPDCVAEPDWLAELDAAFAAGHALIGGPIACGPGNRLGLALYLAKFWRWLPVPDSHPISDMPSANLAVERRLYDAVGGVPEDHISGDTEFCLRVHRQTGTVPWFAARAITRHINEDHVTGAFRERMRRGEAFATFRARQEGWTRLHDAALIVGGPLLVVRHLVTKLARCRRSQAFPLFLATWPLVVVLDASWFLGQARGALAHLLRGDRPGRGDTPPTRMSGGSPAEAAR